MRAVLMPFGSPSGSAYAQKFEITATPPVVPAFDGPDDWQAELNKMYQKEQRNDGLQPESTSGQEDNLQPLQPQDS
jgi:hypothetical protein